MTRPFFSIVMASYLSDYGGRYGNAATDRIAKFHRAVDSVLKQSMGEWELVIVSDGCEATDVEWQRHIDQRVRCIRIPKQRLWSEKVRNAGIHKATGQYIVYLDTDDQFDPDHLRVLRTSLLDADLPAWACFPDLVWDEKHGVWLLRAASAKKGAIGTSNIAHMGAQSVYWPTIEYRWPENGYDHDWQFARSLIKTLGQPASFDSGGYKVCHIPRRYEI